MARMTFSQLISRAQDATGGDTSTSTQTFIKDRINDRYELVKSMIKGYETEVTRTFSTVADQQYYHVPPGLKAIQSLEVTINSVKYPLTPIFSYEEWNRLNAIQVQATAIPQYYFRRRDDFGIYPIPQSAYTSTLVYDLNAQPLYNTDYTTGTVTVTENSQTITGSGTSWNSNAKANQWFVLADSNGKPRGNWYRISAVGSDTSITLETFFEESSESGASYIVGDSPEIPPEAHRYLYFGAVADYFAEKQQSITKSERWENRFWTGDSGNANRDPRAVRSGIILIAKEYEDRDDSQIVRRRVQERSADKKIFATTLSDSS